MSGPPGEPQAAPQLLQRSGSQRRWTAQLAAGVLAVQAAYFIGVLIWSLLAPLSASHHVVIFGPLSLLAVAAVLLVLLRPRPGWVFAMALQCVVLFLSLEIYFIV